MALLATLAVLCTSSTALGYALLGCALCIRAVKQLRPPEAPVRLPSFRRGSLGAVRALELTRNPLQKGAGEGTAAGGGVEGVAGQGSGSGLGAAV